MSMHIKLDKQGYVIELLATNEDAVLANAAPQLLAACEIFVDEVFDDENLWRILSSTMGEKYEIWLTGVIQKAKAAIAAVKPPA